MPLKMVYLMTHENQQLIENPLYLLNCFLFFPFLTKVLLIFPGNLAGSIFLGFENMVQCLEKVYLLCSAFHKLNNLG
jgi:hypothetical protein